MDKRKKNNLIQYGIIAIIGITLYATGLHTEVIGLAQRGLLATGLMNPDMEKIAQVRNNDKESTSIPEPIKADFNMKLMDAKGNITSLETLKGKVIFMNFWATWCPPCIAEMPSINKLHEEMGDKVAFVMISLDRDFELAKAFEKEKGYQLPIYALAGNLPSMYDSAAIPTTYIIDSDGNLVLTHKGMADYHNTEFINFLKSLK